MTLFDLLSRFAVAVGIGLLIGVERGWRQRAEEAGQRAAGIRTFTITALLGAAVGAIAIAAGGIGSPGGGILLAVAFCSYAAVFTVFCVQENRAEKSNSATTAIAGLLTFVLGAFALLGEPRAAAAVGVGAAGVLALRSELHAWLRRISWPELRSAFVLAAMTFVALPVLPDEDIGPFGGINPRDVWLIAIVLASVSFLAYVAVKYFGANRGILVAAAAGGLVSSTAVMVQNARLAASGAGAPRLLAAGAAVATAISFGRVLAIAAVLSPALLINLGPPVVAAGLAAGVYTWFAVRGYGHGADHDRVEFRNPFGFWSVVGFAALLALVMVLSRAVAAHYGAAGAVIGAAAAGLADIDAVTISFARLEQGILSEEQRVFAILAAVASNTISKLVLGAAIGRGRFAMHIAFLSLACLFAGVGALVLARAVPFGW